jgi:glycosyltransferase involved in cell wall biosynthesis
MLTLELKNEFPTLPEIFNSRVLYINSENLTNKYFKHIRPENDTEEQKFESQNFKNVVPNDTFIKNRDNLKNLIDFCKEGKLINIGKMDDVNHPLISIIIPVYNKLTEISKSICSIQNQSMKNIEIIIIDDCSTESPNGLYNDLLKIDPRIRIFYHLKNMGMFRTRVDGFLYSRAKYILQLDPGDILNDDFVLEDLYNLIIKYNLDSVHFSFKYYNNTDNKQISTFIFPSNTFKVKYGLINKHTQQPGYRHYFNRLTRANVILKGLDLVDTFVLNAYKNYWVDIWWNVLINYSINGHIATNRLGYLHTDTISDIVNFNITTEEQRDKAIREFINSWIFDYQVYPKDSKKKPIIEVIKKFTLHNNTYNGIPINLDYLNTNFTAYDYLLNTLIADYFIEDVDKIYISSLLSNYTNKIIYLTNYLKSLNNTLNSVNTGL